jgi:hypothetical protein
MKKGGIGVVAPTLFSPGEFPRGVSREQDGGKGRRTSCEYCGNGE